LGCARERLDGYRAALAEHGLAVDPDLIREGDFYKPRAYAAALELFHLPAPPTAIFASNDVSALGVMEAARDHGVRVPTDLSVVGFDDIPQAEHAHPALTTVRQPLEEMGRVAAQLLLTAIHDPERMQTRVELPTELIVRGSSSAFDRA
jgi:DNA-binding LacI/PurR family transcriptional regulator